MSIDQRTPITRRAALRTTTLSAIGLGLMGPICTPPPAVAAEPLSPAGELVALLARAADLVCGPLRLDDEARGAVWGTIQWLETLVTAADPQHAMMVNWSTRELVPAERPTA